MMEQLEFIFIDNTSPLCKCGCGGEVKWGRKKKAWNKFIYGHHMKIQWQNPEYYAKMSAHAKRIWKNPEYRANRLLYLKNRWKNPEHRMKHSELIKRWWEDPEYRAKKSAQSKRQWQDPVYREKVIRKIKLSWKDDGRISKQSAWFRRMWQNPEYRIKMSEMGKLRWTDNEYRLKQSKWSKQMWENPEYRAKMSEIMKLCWQDPVYREKVMKATSAKPNNLEALFDSLTAFNVRYVGNRAWWRRITYRLPSGDYLTCYKNPDFKITGQPKIIELWGDYWHRGEFPDDIIEGWKNAGIECIVIWEHEWYNKKESVLEQVTNFIKSEE